MQAATASLREELSKVATARRCCVEVELQTLLEVAAEREVGPGEEISYVLPGPMLARRVLELLRTLGEVRVAVRRGSTQLAAQPRRPVRDGWIELTVGARGAPTPGRGGPFREILSRCGRRRCCSTAHLRALVLARGHLSNPRRSYHLEVCLPGDYPVARLAGATSVRGPGFLLASRRGQAVLYLKGRESIAALLGRIGAVETLLAFEDAVASRRMREGINRTVNCELSNVRRVSRAAADQLAAIAFLEENRLLDGLSARLREVVRLRCAYPADDLTSLAGRSGGSIGRSGVFHRLRELVELARASGMGRGGRAAGAGLANEGEGRDQRTDGPASVGPRDLEPPATDRRPAGRGRRASRRPSSSP